MGLLPEFFTLLGIEIFAALSLLSALLDRDVPSPARWLFQGAAAGGLGQLVYTEGFSTSGVIDASRFWISIFYLTISVCSVVGLNVYLVAVPKKTLIASAFASAITVPTVIVSTLFVSSYLTGVDVTLSLPTVLLLIVPALVIGLGSHKFSHKRPMQISNTTGLKLSPPSASSPLESPTTFEPLDLRAILGQWEESQKKEHPVS